MLRLARGLLVAVALVAVGCGKDPIVGTWEGDGVEGGESNELKLHDDLTGDATLYFWLGDDLYRNEFDVVAEETSSGYRIDLECNGDCSSLDFTMDCELHGDDDELDCNGDGKWKSYDFEWKKNP